MAGIDYDAIEAAIVTHLSSNLTASTYLVTQDIDAALSAVKYPVSVCVLFDGLVPQEALSQSPNTPTRDARYLIGLMARGESQRDMSKLLNEAVQEIEHYLNCTGHGYPIYAYSTTLLESARITGAGPKSDTEYGLAMGMTLEIRIMEE